MDMDSKILGAVEIGRRSWKQIALFYEHAPSETLKIAK